MGLLGHLLELRWRPIRELHFRRLLLACSPHASRTSIRLSTWQATTLPSTNSRRLAMSRSTPRCSQLTTCKPPTSFLGAHVLNSPADGTLRCHRKAALSCRLRASHRIVGHSRNSLGVLSRIPATFRLLIGKPLVLTRSPLD